MKKQTESEVQEEITDYLTSVGILWIKTVQNTKSGWSDLICCEEGLFLSIEVKATGEFPTDLQVEKLTKVREAGGYSMYADNVQQVKNYVEDVDSSMTHPTFYDNWIDEYLRKKKKEEIEL